MSLIAMRVARPTMDLHRIRSFYEQVVGLPVLWSFANHDGFDGVIFGCPGEGAQLELVRSPHGVVPAPTNEDALVLFVESAARHELIDRLRRAGIFEVAVDDATLTRTGRGTALSLLSIPTATASSSCPPELRRTRASWLDRIPTGGNS